MITGPRGSRVQLKLMRVEGELIKAPKGTSHVEIVHTNPHHSSSGNAFSSWTGATSTAEESAPGPKMTAYEIILKRGAWGPEHCVLTPEAKDMIERGRWSKEYEGLPAQSPTQQAPPTSGVKSI